MRNTWLSFPSHDTGIASQIGASNHSIAWQETRSRSYFQYYYLLRLERPGPPQDVDIEDQIRNAQFMYPERPWAEISREAISCIQKLLVVQHEARYSVDQAMADPWLSESRCLADITRLEEEAIKP